MEIIRKCPDKHTVFKNSENHFSLVRVLKDYGSDKAALEDLTRIAIGEITERDLTGGSYEQEVEDGKPGNRINVLEAALEGIRDKLFQAMGDSELLEKAAREAVKRINELVEV